jgi:RHH-type proline utilization regulon transcriptional repressor/proline dehydrogenase/delta 1-pyrroline-5-carboxylate dehydrogenase
MTTHTDSTLEQAIQRAGRELWEAIQSERPRIFDKAYWEGAILEWAMKDSSFKVDMFRFVDVFPMLRSREQIQQHIREYLLRPGRSLPTLLAAALRASTSGLAAGLGQATIRSQVEGLARRFIVGESVGEALSGLERLHRAGIAFTVDLLGEATVSEREADGYQTRYRALIEHLADEVRGWSADDVIDRNHLGPIPRANVSLKVSSMLSHIHPADPTGSVAALMRRILPLCLLARERGVFINFDLEQWTHHGITYDLFEEILAHPGLRTWPHLGIVIQAYLKQSRADAERLLALAKSRGAPITVRLVKGAYWDYETVLARQQGWECPVFVEKAQTDASYESLSRFLLSHVDHLLPAFGSHNLRSLLHALLLARELRVPERACEVQMLYGMAEGERGALRERGHRVRVYAPVGALLPGMAYLVRRLLENTSNAGFVRLSHHERRDLSELLQAPAPGNTVERASAMKSGDLSTPFENCPPTDFTRSERREEFASAVGRIEQALPFEVPVVIGGAIEEGGRLLTRPCPHDIARPVSRIQLATAAQADRAVRKAYVGWPDWRDRALAHRAMLVERLGEALEAERDRLAAIQCFEVGKPWVEADADVAEAIDFCRYYARQALVELAPRRQGAVWGEDNVLSYEGRGVCVVIAPWNFPLAILTGMTAAALVAGNTVVMKPAEQSSAVGYALFERMRTVGFPDDVVQFVPGIGEEVGPVLVGHEQVAQVAFTGSKSVGLGIVEQAHRTRPGQPQVKRVVCEMGGKNAIIVDDDADLDEAIHGIITSAFGYAGQKCSACSRVLVLDAVADIFIERLAAAAASIPMGPPPRPGTMLGPVIDEEAYRRLMETIRNPGPGVEPLFVGAAVEGGYYVPPAIFLVGDPSHRLMQQELFGPILGVHRVASFAQALDTAAATEFALTGAVYSRSPEHLEEARRKFRVGNLYLNRGSTGARVGRQPFGGFAMSGIGTKAGGPGYLLWFADPRVVTENTMRRGFTPDLEGVRS